MMGVAGLAGVAALGALASRAGAGPINPPAGAVGPTGKTLVEVEPRTIVNATNTPGDAAAVYILTQPGSYYLTGNITAPSGKAAIRIEASNVTLDLNGFEILGAGSGIATPFLGTQTGITVRNGTLRGGGGIALGFCRMARVEDITCANTPATGIQVGDTSTVQRCVCDANGTNSNFHSGINAGGGSLVSDCVSRGNVGLGIIVGPGSTIRACSTASNAAGGISADSYAVVTACSAASNTGTGIYAGAGSVIDGCSSCANTGPGISGATGATVRACSAMSNAGAGISVTEAGLIADSSSTLNTTAAGHGIVAGGGTTISRCTSNLNGGVGIIANTAGSGTAPGCLIEHCTVRLNTNSGIQTGGGCLIRSNNVVRNNTIGIGGTGIYVNGPGCRIEDNEVSHSNYNGYGIYVNTGSTAGHCFIVRNSVSGHSFSYNFDTNNIYASIFNGTGGSQAGGGNGNVPSQFSTDPWANLAQ